MKLFIAEKPDVARQLRSIYDPSSKYHKNSQYSGWYEGDEYIFAAASGHLFTLKEPGELSSEWQKWDLELLPMNFPHNWPLKQIKGPRTDPGTFKMLKELCKRKDIDEIIVCTDPDREGQLIWGYIEQMIPGIKAPITRAWFKEWSPEMMEQCVDDRVPNTTYKNLELAGRCRAIGDAIEGFNDSRALTCRIPGRQIYSMGRVQTFTQYLVYKREKDILNFVEEPYTVVSMQTESDGKEPLTLRLKTDKKLSANEAKSIIDDVKQDSVVLHKTTKKTTSNVKKLYSTTEIQKEMNAKYGMSANETSDILQKLYSPEYALTTYPRTDVKVISASNAKNHAINALKNLQGTGLFDGLINEVLKNGWKISPVVISKDNNLPHEAITPVFGSIDKSKISRLSDNELKVYKAIVQRFLQAFFPKAEFEETTVTGEINDNVFEVKGKVIVNPGYLRVIGEGSDNVLPPITDGRAYKILAFNTEDKKTTPPSRFTEATLLEAMENAGKFIDDKDELKILKEVKGVGTGATRKGIIETLYNRKYIVSKGKTIYPTETTMKMLDMLPPTPLTSASSTAQMEMMLDDVQSGRLTMDEYLNAIEKRTADFVAAVKEMKVKGMSNNEVIEACPLCDGDIIETDFGFKCNNPDCDFIIWKKIAGKTITKENAQDLLVHGHTGWIKGFTSSKGTKFDAILELQGDKVKFTFDESLDLVCPKCGKPLKGSSKTVSCGDCGWTLWKTIAGKTLTDKQVKELITNGRTGVIKGFKSSKGSTFNASLKFDDNYKATFDFSDSKGSDGKKNSNAICECPECGGDIMENSKSFFCSNWNDGCKVSIWKNCMSFRGAKDITARDAKALFAGKVVKIACKSKAGKDYDGFIHYDKDNNRVEFDLEKD